MCVIGRKILGRVGRRIFFLIIFILEKIQFYAFGKVSLPFKMHKIICFPENLKKFSVTVSPVNLGRDWVVLPKTQVFFLFSLNKKHIYRAIVLPADIKRNKTIIPLNKCKHFKSLLALTKQNDLRT